MPGAGSSAPQPTTTSPPTTRWIASLVALGISIAAWSASVPRSYDETYWLVVVHRVFGGDLLYRDVIDNKAPLWHAVLAGLDALPGSFTIWRAVAVGGLSTWIAFRARQLGLGTGSTARAATVTGVLAGVLVALLSRLVLTVESVAVALTLEALIRAGRQPAIAAALALVGSAIDPRILVVAPAIVLKSASEIPTGLKRTSTVFATGFAVAVALFAWSPDLRFGLVEVSRSTRFLNTWNANQFLTMATVVALPPVASAVFLKARPPGSAWSWWYVFSAFAVASASLLPIAHYWTYCALIPSLLPATGRASRASTAFTVTGIAAAILPLVIWGANASARNGAEIEKVVPLVEYLRQVAEPADRVLAWTAEPHFAYEWGETLGRAPNILYLGWDTSRRADHLRDWSELAASATVIVVDQPLRPDQLLPGYREPASLVQSQIATRLSCGAQVDTYQVFLDDSRCRENSD